jgi:hypothetical protein
VNHALIDCRAVACHNLLSNSMNMKRFAAFIGILLFLFGAWGQALAAAFCSGSGRLPDCCVSQAKSEKDQHNHNGSAQPDADMAGMADIDQPAASRGTGGDGDSPAVRPPAQQCSHCISHSEQQFSSFLTISTSDGPRRSASALLPVPIFAFTPTSPSVYLFISNRQHAPPGGSPPLFLLLSVFRI